MKSMQFSINFLLCLLISLFVIPGSVSAKATTETFHQEKVEIISAWNPCTGSIRGTLQYDATFHVTENKRGYHSILVMNGTAFVEPLGGNPTFIPFTGKLNEIITQHVTGNQDFYVQVITQKDKNLSFHITFIISYDEGVPSVKVFNISCGP